MPEQTKTTVKRTERGWGGHFIRAAECRFRRNTLLECGEVKIVVSTVGAMEYPENPCIALGEKPEEWEEIRRGCYYETMAFHSDAADTLYHDADISRQVHFDSPWAISDTLEDSDNRANEMHEAVVEEITLRLSHGETFTQAEEDQADASAGVQAFCDARGGA